MSSIDNFSTKSLDKSVRILLFGTFDPLHEGHRTLFRQVAALGDHLTVVVARDTVIQAQKGRPAFMQERDRLTEVAQDVSVDTAMLGDTDPSSYALLASIPFDILALGYDQIPPDSEVRTILDDLGLSHIRIVRLGSYHPEQYKSSLLRT